MTHKDGLTAKCRHFDAREDYRGAHWIRCTMGTKAFETAWERNQYYSKICCGHPGSCLLLNIHQDRERRGPIHE